MKYTKKTYKKYKKSNVPYSKKLMEFAHDFTHRKCNCFMNMRLSYDAFHQTFNELHKNTFLLNTSKGKGTNLNAPYKKLK